MTEVALRDGQAPTYSGSVTGLVALAGDFLTFTAPVTNNRIMRLTRVSMTGVATAATDAVIQLIHRSSLDTGGTGTAQTCVANDPNSQGGNSTVVTSYTAAPTPGAAVGTPIRSANWTAALTGTGQSYALTWQWGDRAAQAPRLYGSPSINVPPNYVATTQLCLNISGTIAGLLMEVDWEFTEDIV
jgi:hypothetical protein